MNVSQDIIVTDLMSLPYVEGGRIIDGAMPAGGIDCWGFVMEIRERAGLWTPDPWGLGRKPATEHPEGLPEAFMRHVIEIPEPIPYCAVKLRSPWPGGHAGVYLPSGRVAHLPRDGGRCEPHTRMKSRKTRILAYYDFSKEPV